MIVGTVFVAAAFVAAGSMSWTCNSAVSETFKLTAIGGPPPVALSVKVTKEFFLPEVNKRLAAAGSPHRIEWTEAWSGSVASCRGFRCHGKWRRRSRGPGRPFEGSKLPLENITFHVTLRDHRSDATGRNFPFSCIRQVPGMELRSFTSTTKSISASWALIPTAHIESSDETVRGFERPQDRR